MVDQSDDHLEDRIRLFHKCGLRTLVEGDVYGATIPDLLATPPRAPRKNR